MLITIGQVGLTAFLYVFGSLVLGLSFFPAGFLFYCLWTSTLELPPSARILLLGFSGAFSYFIFGLSLMMVSGFTRILFRLNLKEGTYPAFSVEALKWYFTNALQYLVTIVFMDFLLLTPFASLFFRLMGARLGKNVQINSKFCADLSLLKIGDGTVIGGHATVIGHSFERGQLILKPVIIGKQAVIGLNSVILPGCEIGDKAVVAAGAVLPKNTRVEPGAVYSGVPAERIK